MNNGVFCRQEKCTLTGFAWEYLSQEWQLCRHQDNSLILWIILPVIFPTTKLSPFLTTSAVSKHPRFVKRLDSRQLAETERTLVGYSHDRYSKAKYCMYKTDLLQQLKLYSTHITPGACHPFTQYCLKYIDINEKSLTSDVGFYPYIIWTQFTLQDTVLFSALCLSDLLQQCCRLSKKMIPTKVKNTVYSVALLYCSSGLDAYEYEIKFRSGCLLEHGIRQINIRAH